ncbi:MAG: toll/interleukin-1 receptor domain-containing protein [Mucilaginibacter sp.]|nr:toll/interleukin-1 receptor domain-containing protein [Mucilaginibacter sp.]
MDKKYDIFISHSKEDNKLAVALCHFLEERQFRCWMAPRDVQAGKDYAICIIEAIQSSRIMVVILSEYSNRSHHVRNEVERAFNHQVAILPFRIKDVIPEQSLEYFLSSYHWLDAIEGQAENYFEDLHRHCFALLRTDEPLPPIDDRRDRNRNQKDNNRDKQKIPVVQPKKTGIYIAGAAILALLLFFVILKPMFDKNTIEFKNNAPTFVLIDLNGKTDTIGINSSFIYSGRKNSRLKTNAYSYSYNTKGNLLGTKIQWNIDTLVHADGNYIYNLNVSSRYFFLKITNNTDADINYISVNSLDQNEKIAFPTRIPNDGTSYGVGYYKILSDTKIELWNTKNYHLYWNNGDNLHFNDSFNQVITLTYK